MIGTVIPPAPEETRRHRILFLVNVSWFFVSHRLALAEGALAAGYDVHVATRVTSVDDAATITRRGLTLHHVEIGRGDSGLWYDLRSMIEIWHLFRRLQPDLVHNVAMKPVIFGGIVARFGGVRRVVQAVPGLGSGFSGRGRGVEIRRKLLLWALGAACGRRGTLVILQNIDDIQTLVGAGVIASDAAVLIRGSGVDVTAISLQPEPQGRVRIVLAARMLREKGIREFVTCARLLREQGVNAEFLLAGDPDPSNPGSLSTAELEHIAASGVVTYLGHVRDVPALFATCHVVCLPTYYGEGVPKVLIEAAASGRAIVTTDIPGCRDIVQGGVNGLLVPVREVPALAAALRQVIDDPVLRRRFGTAGRERALREFDFSIVLAQTLKTYARLLGPPCESW